MKVERWKMKDERWKTKDQSQKMKHERWEMTVKRWKKKDENAWVEGQKLTVDSFKVKVGCSKSEVESWKFIVVVDSWCIHWQEVYWSPHVVIQQCTKCSRTKSGCEGQKAEKTAKGRKNCKRPKKLQKAEKTAKGRKNCKRPKKLKKAEKTGKGRKNWKRSKMLEWHCL